MDTNTFLGLFLLVAIPTIVIVVLLWNRILDKRSEQQRQDEIYAHLSEWGETICSQLANKHLAIGMTTKQVALSWGQPSYTDQREITKNGEKIRWVYGIPRKGANYVWFTDAKVTKIKT